MLIVPAMDTALLESMLARMKLSRDDTLMDVSESKRENAVELGVKWGVDVTDAVIERIAVLDIMKR